jgi:hypothetical protein
MRKYAWLALAGLVGCATEAKFAERMNSVVGQPEIAVVSKLGPPASTHQMPDGHRVLQWTDSRTINMVMPGTLVPVNTYTTGQAQVTTATGMPAGSANYSQQSTTMVQGAPTVIPMQQSCALVVTIDPKGLVKEWTARGNNCRAR